MEKREKLTSSILQSPTFRLHSILLHDAPNEVVNVSGVINLPDERAGRVGGLTTGKDVEVVVCGVSAGVAFGADGCAKDDDVSDPKKVKNKKRESVSQSVGRWGEERGEGRRNVWDVLGDTGV